MEDDEQEDRGKNDGTGELSLSALWNVTPSVYGGFDGPNPSDNQEHLSRG